MKIALDVMGGDNAPLSNLKGAITAIKQLDIDIVLLGDYNIIKNNLLALNYDITDSRISINHCEDVITYDEEPVKAVRTKKMSSLVVGLNLLKNKQVDAVVSAGSTGAILAGGLFIVGRISGIDRPALTALFPNENGGSLILDVGANSNCKIRNLDEFALMGSIYSKNILNIDNPKVALVNIGTEDNKGNDLYKNAFKVMKNNKNYNFIGNIEARDIPFSKVDVIVCDGFTGNIIIKLSEGVAKRIFSLVKKALIINIITKISSIFIKKSLKSIMNELDSDEQGGVPLLGIDGIVIKAHGSSNDKAIFNAIRQSKIIYDNNTIDRIKEYAKNIINNDIIE